MMTPEQVQLAFEVAGIGTRAMAQLLDAFLLTIFLGLFWGGFFAWSILSSAGSIFNYIGAFGILLTFVILWAYFILFEYFWSGQTIGKRIMRIRVIRRNGMSVTFFAALVRNLLRLLDFLPVLYCIGLISMIIDKFERRVGDLAAGTIVVKDTSRSQLGLLDVSKPTGVGNRHEAVRNAESPVFLKIESQGLTIILSERLPADVEYSVLRFAKRKKQLTRFASEQIAEMLWAALERLPMVQIELTGPKSEDNSVPYMKKSIVEILAKLGKEFSRLNKG